MPDDPTLAALRALDDPERWTVIRDVPVFDAHDEYDDKGKLLRRFDRKALQEIADHCNLREEATGDLTLIGPGHTLRNVYDPKGNVIHRPKENDQPIPFGVARNYRVGTFGPSNRLALLCDQYVRKDRYADYLTYPRRSVELWYARKEIDWIACLRKAPERELGLITDLAPPVAETNLVPVHLAPKSTDSPRAFQRSADQLLVYELGQYYATPAPSVVGAATEPQTMERNPMHEFMTKLKGLLGEYEASCASGTNTFVPSAVKEKEPAHHDRETEAERMAREQSTIRYERIEKQIGELSAANKALADENAQLRLDYQRQTAEREVIQVEAEGVELDRAALVEELAPLSPEKRAQKLEYVRKYHRRGPGPDMIGIRREPSEGGVRKSTMTRERMQEAVSFATRNGKSFDAAAKEIN